MTREDFNIGWKVVYGIVVVVDVIIYFQAKEFWLSYLGFITFLLVILPLIYLLITEDREGFGFYLGILLLIVICWIASFKVEFTKEALVSDAQNYILSSISQGLAALFALVFTISLVAAQMSTRYSARALKILFTPKIIAFMVLFVFGIIFPLIVMKTNSICVLDFSIGIAGTCVILIIPYFLNFRKIIDPELLLDDFAHEALTEMKITKRISTKMQNIENIVITAQRMGDYYLYGKGLRKLFSIFIEVNDLTLIFDFQKLTSDYYEISKNDEKGKNIIIESLRLSGEDSVYNKSMFANEMICASLFDIGGKELKDKKNELAVQVSWSLMKIGVTSVLESEKYGLFSSIKNIKQLYLISLQENVPICQFMTVQHLWVIGGQIVDNLDDISPLIDTFKEIEIENMKDLPKRMANHNNIIMYLKYLVKTSEDKKFGDALMKIVELVKDISLEFLQELSIREHIAIVDFIDIIKYIGVIIKRTDIVFKSYDINHMNPPDKCKRYLEMIKRNANDDFISDKVDEAIRKIDNQIIGDRDIIL